MARPQNLRGGRPSRGTVHRLPVKLTAAELHQVDQLAGAWDTTRSGAVRLSIQLAVASLSGGTDVVPAHHENTKKDGEK